MRAGPADSDEEEVEQSDEEPGSSGGLPIKLSSTRRADVSEFKGKTFINIREYYEVKTFINIREYYEVKTFINIREYYEVKTFINIREYYEVQCGCLMTCRPFHCAAGCFRFAAMPAMGYALVCHTHAYVAGVASHADCITMIAWACLHSVWACAERWRAAAWQEGHLTVDRAVQHAEGVSEQHTSSAGGRGYRLQAAIVTEVHEPPLLWACCSCRIADHMSPRRR